MKYLFLCTLLFSMLSLKAQFVSEAHTFDYINYYTIKKENKNTIFWFNSSFDSIVLNNKAFIYKNKTYGEGHAYFVILDSAENLSTYKEFYSDLYSISFDANILDYDDGYFVSFYYNGNALWMDKDIICEGATSGKFQCILKLSKSGNLLSCWRYPVTRPVYKTIIKPLPDNKLVIAGTLSSYDETLGTFPLPCIGCHEHDSDVFVAVLDSNGIVLNAKRFGSDVWDYCNAMLTTESGDIYLTGSYYGRPFEVDGFSLSNYGFTQLTSDAFLLKMNKNLEVQWLQRAWGEFSEGGWALDMDKMGNIYWAGNYNSPQVTLGDITVTGNKANSYLALVEPSGYVKWVQNFTADEVCYLRDLDSDENGNAWVTINFGQIFDFAGQSLVGQGDWENATIQFNPEGQLVQYYHMTGPEAENVYQIQALPDNSLLLVGVFYDDTLSFLNMQLPGNPNAGDPTYFFATLDLPTVPTNQALAPEIPMRVVPNPAATHQAISVEFGPEFEAGKGWLFVHDYLGRLVAQYLVDQPSRKLVLSAGFLKPGMYLLSYQSDKGLDSRLLIVTD